MTPQHEIVTQKTIVSEKDTSRIVKLDAPPEFMGKVYAYLKEMGMSDELQTLMAATAPKDVHWLSHAELVATHMATDYYGGENLIVQSSLAQTPEPTVTAPSAASQGNHRDEEPKREVASLAYALLKMPGFTEHEVNVSFELLHRKDASTVEVSALVEEREGFIPTGNLALVLQLGTWRQAPMFVAASALPTAPLSGTIPVSNLCGALKINGFIQLILVQLTSGAKISGPPGIYDLHRFNLMPDLLADICKSDANTAAQKLERLWH